MDARPDPGQRNFEVLIAHAILFREADRIVGRLDFGGYRANIVAYTVAYLSHATCRRVDFGRVWREQGITRATADAVAGISRLVHGTLVTPPPGRKNVTEWCKKKECWEAVKSIEYAMQKRFVRNYSRPTATTGPADRPPAKFLRVHDLVFPDDSARRGRCVVAEFTHNARRDRPGQERGHGVTDLAEAVAHVSMKPEGVGKGLESGGLPD